MEKPLGTEEQGPDGVDPWPPPVYERWRRVLDLQVEAYDSVDILDDVATALLALEFESDLRRVLERSRAILIVSLGDARDVEISWAVCDNRPALRGLDRLFELDRDDDEERACESANLILEVNPNDKHGLRG